MAPCDRCGTGARYGRGRGWCSNETCRKEEQAEKQAAKRVRLEGRAAKGAGERGPCPGHASAQARKQVRKETRQKEGTGAESGCADEEGPTEHAPPPAPEQARKEEQLQEEGIDERDPGPIAVEELKAKKAQEVLELHGPPFPDESNSPQPT